jgi:hypothetical protein
VGDGLPFGWEPKHNEENAMRVIGARATRAVCLATALLFASHPASAEDEWLTSSSLIKSESQEGTFERYDAEFRCAWHL